jgi:hypothetical protein
MNYFEALADTQQNAHSKARDRSAAKRLEKLVVKSDADAPMVPSATEKEQRERQQLLRQFNKAMTQRRVDLLKGPHAKEIKGLFQILDSMTASSAPALMSYLAKCQWFVSADYGTRHDILYVVDTSIMRFRIRQGLSPIDDGLPGEPPTVFCIVRHHLTGAPLS